MNEQLGNQGGFKGITGAAEQFKESSGIFKTAVGKWAFGVLSMKKIMGTNAENLKSAGNTTIQMTGVLGGLSDVFTKSKIVDVIADLSSSLYDTRKDLERTYGLFGDGRNVITDSLRDQTLELNKFGIRLTDTKESFVALASAFGTTTFNTDLAGTASKISKAFGIGKESAAQLTFSLTKFGGKGPKAISTFMEKVNKDAFESQLSFTQVADVMASSAKSMYRFQLNTGKGEIKFRKLAISAGKMGISIDHMVDAMDQYRTIPGAIQGSVTASLAGLNIGVDELIAGARGSDPSYMFGRVFDYLKGFTDPETGSLSSQGIDIADMLGPMVNMSRNEMQNALARMAKTGGDSLGEYKTMNERLRLQSSIMERLESAMYNIGKVIWPMVDPIFGILEFVTKSAGFTQLILKSILGYIVWRKGSRMISSGLRAGSGLAEGTFGPLLNMNNKAFSKKNFIRGLFGKNIGPEDIGNASNGRVYGNGTQPQGTDGRFVTNNGGMSGAQMTGKSRMMLAQAGQMASAAVMMLAFAGSIMMLAKSFQMFGEVNWKNAKYGGLVVAGFTVAMVALGALVAVAAPAWAGLLAMGGMMILFAGSMMILAKATSMFVDPITKLSTVSFENIGNGLVSLAKGMGAMMLIGAIGGPLGFFGLAFGLSSTIVTISAIGKLAEKYGSPIETMANAISILATSLEKLQAIESIKNIDFNIDSSTLKNLERVSLAMSGLSNTPEQKIIENHITIDLDGVKLYRGIHKSIADSRGGS